MAKEKYGFTCDYKYVVGIYDTSKGTLKFVDSIDNSTRVATWKKGAKPLVMSKTAAIDLQMGLMCNGSNAMVIEVPDFFYDNLRNVEELYETDRAD